ncbi:hypothetical protein [Spongiactinospora sp. TRM90649]|uniref:hypothetical protein n=1 Tax=Spongiactinospora sp. TRM90649 TaxID=3031114 RepID=UPI0023F7DD46|nr:hypothetical protein [Spongiactinospora sp. TRM90649]MDF5751204.1 hypothetical protein [Spongiactinospora sp. TRM90649]
MPVGKPRKKWPLAVTALAVTTLALIAGVAWAFPSVASTTCPACYGMESLAPGVHAESGLPADRKRQVVETVELANERVTAFYGGRKTSPSVLACLSDDCYRRIGGGGERGVAVLNRAVMLSPRGVDPVIASHELSHVELHARLGDAQVPQWFDEGLAVVVSDDPRNLAPKTTPDRCLKEPDAPLPTTLDAWLRTATADPTLYAKAACKVTRWLQSNGGPPALHSLTARLSQGTPFNTLIHP